VKKIRTKNRLRKLIISYQITIKYFKQWSVNTLATWMWKVRNSSKKSQLLLKLKKEPKPKWPSKTSAINVKMKLTLAGLNPLWILQKTLRCPLWLILRRISPFRKVIRGPPARSACRASSITLSIRIACFGTGHGCTGLKKWYSRLTGRRTASTRLSEPLMAAIDTVDLPT